MSVELRPFDEAHLDATFRLERLTFGAPAVARQRCGEQVAQSTAYGLGPADCLG